MMYDEQNEIWKTFVELYDKGLADTVVSIKFGEDEIWTYGSFRYNGISLDIETAIKDYIKENKWEDTNSFLMHLVYLPFSVEPIHIVSKMTRQEILNLLAFEDDLITLMTNALVNELKNHITHKYEKLAHSNGKTYRTFDHVFDNNWSKTLKNTQDIDYLDSNNQ